MPISGYRTSPETFKAETLDDKIRIPLDYTKQVRDIQGKFNELENSAESLYDYLKNNPDSEEAKTYQAYMDMLNEGVESFMRSGNLQYGYNNFLNAKRKFTKEISPIAVAIKARQEAIVEDDKSRKTDRTLFGQSPRNSSIHDWMNGNIPEFQTWSGNTLYSYAKDMAAGISNRYYDDPEIQKIRTGILDIITTKGIDAAPMGIGELYQKGEYPELNQIIDSLLINNGFDPKQLTENDISTELATAMNYISQGIAAGLIYEEHHNTISDPTYTKPTPKTQTTPKEPNVTQITPYRTTPKVRFDPEKAKEANEQKLAIESMFSKRAFDQLSEQKKSSYREVIERYLDMLDINHTIEEIQNMPDAQKRPIMDAIIATIINPQHTNVTYSLNMKNYEGFTNVMNQAFSDPDVINDDQLNSFVSQPDGKIEKIDDITKDAKQYGLSFDENNMYLSVVKSDSSVKVYKINSELVPKMIDGNVYAEYDAYKKAAEEAKKYAEAHQGLYNGTATDEEKQKMYELNYQVAFLGDAIMRMIYEAAESAAPSRPSTSSTIANVGMAMPGSEYYQ